MSFGRLRRIHFQIISYTTYKESFKSYFNGIVADIAIYSTQSGRWVDATIAANSDMKGYFKDMADGKSRRPRICMSKILWRLRFMFQKHYHNVKSNWTIRKLKPYLWLSIQGLVELAVLHDHVSIQLWRGWVSCVVSDWVV